MEYPAGASARVAACEARDAVALEPGVAAARETTDTPPARAHFHLTPTHLARAHSTQHVRQRLATDPRGDDRQVRSQIRAQALSAVVVIFTEQGPEARALPLCPIRIAAFVDRFLQARKPSVARALEASERVGARGVILHTHPAQRDAPYRSTTHTDSEIISRKEK
eukprot:1797632-Rhodomonas_salina.4